VPGAPLLFCALQPRISIRSEMAFRQIQELLRQARARTVDALGPIEPPPSALFTPKNAATTSVIEGTIAYDNKLNHWGPQYVSWRFVSIQIASPIAWVGLQSSVDIQLRGSLCSSGHWLDHGRR